MFYNWIPPVVITEEIPEIYQALISNNFQQGDFECEICFDDKEGFLCHRMSNCGHVFCQVQGLTDDKQHQLSASPKPWLGMSFWVLFIPNSRWSHKSNMSQWRLRRTNITAGHRAACRWRWFLAIWSTSVSEERDLCPEFGPVRRSLRSTVRGNSIKDTRYDERHCILSEAWVFITNSTPGYKW